MKDRNIRWIQRTDSFSKALIQLQDAVTLSKTKPLSRLEELGMIQGFEYTHEIAWKAMKDFLEEYGNDRLSGSKNVTRAAFKRGVIEDEETWMGMIKSRNQTSHTYEEEVAAQIVNDIINHYFNNFILLQKKLNHFKLKAKEDPIIP